MNTNLILSGDSYKLSHHLQLPPTTEYMSSYIESRGGVHSDTVFFGLQAYIREYLSQPITEGDIYEAENVAAWHMPPGFTFNRAGWEHILDRWGGMLPLEICSVNEGVRVGVKNAIVQVRNTDPKVPWLVSFMETPILRAIWYATTVATVSRHIRDTLERYSKLTCDDFDVSYQLHDFGSRGASSEESAALGGLAHLINFSGTDTLSALLAGREYYGAEKGFANSIPASEHSTMSSWGRSGEVEAYRNMITQFGGKGAVFACVSDTWDIYNASNHLWGETLKEEVLSSGATLVVRPDSGDPIKVPVDCVRMLWDKFGGSINHKGYKVLHPSVRVIQGDGINPDQIESIFAKLAGVGFASENLAIGMGGALLQKVDRDTQKFAMKTSAIKLAGSGRWVDIYKDPVTDPGKKSKRGRQKLITNRSGGYETRAEGTCDNKPNHLVLRYHNGCTHNRQTFEDVRRNSGRYNV